MVTCTGLEVSGATTEENASAEVSVGSAGTPTTGNRKRALSSRAVPRSRVSRLTLTSSGYDPGSSMPSDGPFADARRRQRETGHLAALRVHPRQVRNPRSAGSWSVLPSRWYATAEECT
ncbi:hypothetical protein H7I76_11925, partial [Mycolicibacterium vaccae]|nr:hypothetical protein [Mycolicibacterium vaccae]